MLVYKGVNGMRMRKGYNNNNLKYRNRGIVLQLVATRPIFRADITKRVGLSRMAITNIVGELIDEGYIVESAVDENSLIGRNPILLDIAGSSPLSAGLYIARSSIHVILTDIRLKAFYTDKISLENETKESLMQKIFCILDGLFEFHKSNMSERRVLGIGISSIGPFDPENAELLNPRDFFGIENLPLKDSLESRYSLPVYAQNDMNASALAEHLMGQGRSCNNFMYLGITNGIGAGIIINRHLYGEGSISVGEIGHMSINYEGPLCSCGNRGCLETYATMPVILKRLERALGGKKVELEDFKELSENAECDAVFKDVAEKLSISLVNAVNLLDPERVVIGHEGIYLPERYLDLMRKEIEARILSSGYKSVPVVHSAFSMYAPLYGSAAIILTRLFAGDRI